MKGNICIVSETGWAVSNDAVLDYHKEIIDTPEGRRTVENRVFEVRDPFGRIERGEEVKVAFEAEDGKKESYRCMVTMRGPSTAFIKILDRINEYKQILERVLSWR